MLTFLSRYENVAPMDYFLNLVTTFETDMTDYRKQIDETQSISILKQKQKDETCDNDK